MTKITIDIEENELESEYSENSLMARIAKAFEIAKEKELKPDDWVYNSSRGIFHRAGNVPQLKKGCKKVSHRLQEKLDIFVEKKGGEK